MELANGCGIELNLSSAVFADWKSELYRLIASVDLQYRERFLGDASGSVHRQIYSRLCHNLQLRNYFRDELSVDEISMIFKLRGELLHLNYIPHRDELPVLCCLCNLEEREDILHFVGRCPILKEIRRSFFGSDTLADTQTMALLNEVEVSKLYNYSRLALVYRGRIIDENF